MVRFFLPLPAETYINICVCRKLLVLLQSFCFM